MTWKIEIERIAGILRGSATIEPGLNAVRASNWQGKSSFVGALKTAIGVSRPLTEGKDSGQVELHTPSREIDVELLREQGTVERAGTPCLTDEYDIVRAELFACLDEHNAVRRAVQEGDSLEDVLLEPLEFQNIDEQIADCERERERVESELTQAQEADRRLSTIKENVSTLESELDALRTKRAELSGGDSTSTPQSAQSDLAQARVQREQAQNRIDRLQRSIERTESRLEEKRSELADLETDDDKEDIATQLAAAREQHQQIQSDIEVLQSVYSANRMVLNKNRLDLITEVNRELMDDTVVCWTCGAETQREEITAQIDALGDQIATLRAKTESTRDEVERLEARREEITQARQLENDLESEIDSLEGTLADHRQSLEEATTRREQAQHRIEDAADSVEESVEAITTVESEIKYREAELEDAREELAQLQRRAQRLDTLQSERANLTAEIEQLRDRKEQIKYDTREAFDSAMADILARFDTGFETARLTGTFDLVVARGGQEASLDALSEGELQLLGFVAALAGHEAFDVDETVPIMLVDGISGLADENLHTLIDYLRDRTEYLVFTVYPEHTAFDGTEIDPTAWDVSSSREPPTE